LFVIRACLDSWKLYVNYRKIKNYFTLRNKAKIFNILKKNLTNIKNIDKKSNLLKYIYTTKHVINKLKTFALKIKNKKINSTISSEFRRNHLMKNTFMMMLNHHSIYKKFTSEYNNLYKFYLEDLT
jgi:hypothetical protein